MNFDLVIRGGLVVDGSGGEPFVGDVAVRDGRIAALGRVDGRATEEVDATGLLVTPGFVDIHTHYDGQAIWSERLSPSSNNGVTTAVIGNCGVGFAPCRPQDRERLIDVMQGVEDIPGVVMAAGLPWNWESFPEYLDALEARPRDIDVAAFLPHSPLRVYVMGERGARREPATAADRARMKALASEAMQAGALGFATSQLMIHRTGRGESIPSYAAGVEELHAIAEGLAEAGGGLLQFVPDIPTTGDYAAVLEPLFGVARDTGLPLTFTLGLGNSGPRLYPDALALVERFNAAGGNISAQLLPRPVGLLCGLELSVNPFVLCPGYQPLARLELAERVREMRRPEVRARLLAETPAEGHPLTALGRNWEWMFPMGEAPDYEPPRASSILARAQARGVTPAEEAYDRLLDDEGRSLMMVALGNFENNSLDALGQLLQRDDVVVGLGDGGAHYGMICDASYTTFMLTHWCRDRASGRLGLAQTVRALSARPAEVAGLNDRGRLAPGLKADLNLIDHARLRLLRPRVVHDLPNGERRLDQATEGFVATYVAGHAIVRDDRPTGTLPGRLVRGAQPAPADA